VAPVTNVSIAVTALVVVKIISLLNEKNHPILGGFFMPKKLIFIYFNYQIGGKAKS
jgi:hypothetical protein